MSEIVTYAPAIVTVSGANPSERKLSVMRDASPEAALALVSQGGKVGTLARQRAAGAGKINIANAAARGNFKPVAEYIAARTGKSFVITSKAAFESLADQFESQIMNAKNAKNGGYTTAKSGIQKPSAALSLALELKAFVTEVIAEAGAIAAQRAEERRAQRALEQ